MEGLIDGTRLGYTLGLNEGPLDPPARLGSEVTGTTLGIALGDKEGDMLGFTLGTVLGLLVGETVGDEDGAILGDKEGVQLGHNEGDTLEALGFAWHKDGRPDAGAQLKSNSLPLFDIATQFVDVLP